MRTETAPRKDMWNEFIDRDLDLVISGKPPSNDDLVPLQSFVVSLNDFAEVPVSAEFVDRHATEAAATIKTLEPATTPDRLSRTRILFFGVKRRVVAMATSLMMILGMTGVAWAADGAVPGEWNYGIDRALEAVGIGAGGAEERLQELAAVFAEEDSGRSDSNPGQNPVVVQDEPTEMPDVVGVEKAADAVAGITAGTERADEVRSGVSNLLEYLANSGEIDGQTVADAHQLNPNPTPSSQRPNQPPETGKPAETGTP